MPDPVNGKFHLINISPGDKLRAGDIVNARVKAVLPNGRFHLYCNGRLLTAKSSLHLHQGQSIRGKVVQNGSTLFLQLSDNQSKSKGMALFQQSSDVLLSASLLRAGLSLSGGVEDQRRAALLRRTRGPRLRIARMYAELLAKGTDPGALFLEHLDNLFSGHDKHHGSRHWPTLPQPEELQEELCGDSDENSEKLLNLINNVPGKRDSWMFQKLVRKFKEGELKMVWKIRQGINPALALTVYDGNRTLEFLMEGLDHTRLTVYADEETVIDEKKWNSFRKNLALKNFVVDDTLLPISRSDGFTPGSDEVMQNLEGLT